MFPASGKFSNTGSRSTQTFDLHEKERPLVPQALLKAFPVSKRFILQHREAGRRRCPPNENEGLLDREETVVSVEMDVGADRLPSIRDLAALRSEEEKNA